MSDARTPRITLIGKPDCHLCDDARAVIAQVCAATGESWTELSILDDPVLVIRTGEGPDDLAPFEPAAFVDALLG